MTEKNLTVEILSLLCSVFPEIAQDKLKEFNRDLNYEWDSLKQIELVTELEEFYDTELTLEEVIEIKDLESAVQVILKRI